MRNLGIKDLDFATVHVYPSNWGVPNTSYSWVNDNWIGDRAALAAAAGKPLLLEVQPHTPRSSQHLLWFRRLLPFNL